MSLNDAVPGGDGDPLNQPQDMTNNIIAQSHMSVDFSTSFEAASQDGGNQAFANSGSGMAHQDFSPSIYKAYGQNSVDTSSVPGHVHDEFRSIVCDHGNDAVRSLPSSTVPSLQSTPPTSCNECLSCPPSTTQQALFNSCCLSAPLNCNTAMLQQFYSSAGTTDSCNDCVSAFPDSSTGAGSTLAAGPAVPCDDETCLQTGINDATQVQPCVDEHCDSAHMPQQSLFSGGGATVICHDNHCDASSSTQAPGADCTGEAVTTNGTCRAVCDGVVSQEQCADEDCNANAIDLCMDATCSQAMTYPGLADSATTGAHSGVPAHESFPNDLQKLEHHYCCSGASLPNGSGVALPESLEQCLIPHCHTGAQPQFLNAFQQDALQSVLAHCHAMSGAPHWGNASGGFVDVPSVPGFHQIVPWAMQGSSEVQAISSHTASQQQQLYDPCQPPPCPDLNCHTGMHAQPSATHCPDVSTDHDTSSQSSSQERKRKRKRNSSSDTPQRPELTPEQLKWIEERRSRPRPASSRLRSYTASTSGTSSTNMSRTSSMSHISQASQTTPSSQATQASQAVQSAPEDSAEEEIHECGWGECTLTFPNTKELQAHVVDEHVGDRQGSYSCHWRDCTHRTGRFDQKQKIRRHVQTHTGDKPWECETCHKFFSEKNTLRQHERSHTGEKPFKCKWPGCVADFGVQSSLTIHFRTHTGEKPFKCTFPGCNKDFPESSNLKKHERMHSNERPFMCTFPGCFKHFGRPDQVTRHQETHLSGEDRERLAEERSKATQAKNKVKAQKMEAQAKAQEDAQDNASGSAEGNANANGKADGKGKAKAKSPTPDAEEETADESSEAE